MAMKKFDETKRGISGLCNDGITSIPKVSDHLPEALRGIKKHIEAVVAIPIINFLAVDSPDDWSNLMRRVGDVARTWGFFQVTNHRKVKELDVIVDSI
ncbi:hypothetical protein MLD38_035532 [Melastoma candidum]|uniref:Uncharacterized protein n=1 Tax=Melastoma candidum TaxID=119954 RepID=A0ACB9LHI9_9MYRT|nr:hypothetical protein MLD38_035532 [Melastoma candidum]